MRITPFYPWFFLFIFIATAGLLVSENIPEFNWPQVRGDLPELKGITSTFGESRGDHFHTGLDLASYQKPVHAPADGSVLYIREISYEPFGPVPGAGNFLILDHGQGWWSGYFHMDSLSPVPPGNTFHRGEKIGESGNTGHSYGAHLHFFITRDSGETYINPFLVLPPVTDANPPSIGSLKVHTGNTFTRIPENRPTEIRLTRPFPVTVEIIDPGLEKNTRRGIYTLSWTINNGPKQSLTFDRIENSPSGWNLSGKYGFQRIFYESDYLLGEIAFENGENILELETTDFQGNTSRARYQIRVVREF